MVKCSPLRDIETQKRMHRNDWPIGKAAGWQSYFKEKSFYFLFFGSSVNRLFQES